MKIIRLTIVSILLFCVFSCSKEDNNGVGGKAKDEQKPTIKLNYPTSCAKLIRGQKFTMKATVEDNLALASYAIDFHNNFDHHTHDNQGSKCALEPIKNTTEKTFKFLENYTIKNRPKKYEISQIITIPADADTGDYHCHISVTDVTGWSVNTSVDVKIVESTTKK